MPVMRKGARRPRVRPSTPPWAAPRYLPGCTRSRWAASTSTIRRRRSVRPHCDGMQVGEVLASRRMVHGVAGNQFTQKREQKLCLRAPNSS